MRNVKRNISETVNEQNPVIGASGCVHGRCFHASSFGSPWARSFRTSRKI